MRERRVVNLIGHPGSGKSIAAKHVGETHGFEVVRASQLIEIYAQRNGLALKDRAAYLACRDGMLKDNPDVFVEPALQRPDSHTVYDGLRLPAEIDKLRRLSKMAVIALSCPRQIRFQRAMESQGSRGTRDKATYEEFIADEAVDYYSADRACVSVLTVMEEADYWIDTQSLSKSEMLEKVDSALLDAGIIG